MPDARDAGGREVHASKTSKLYREAIDKSHYGQLDWVTLYIVMRYELSMRPVYEPRASREASAFCP